MSSMIPWANEEEDGDDFDGLWDSRMEALQQTDTFKPSEVEGVRDLPEMHPHDVSYETYKPHDYRHMTLTGDGEDRLGELTLRVVVDGYESLGYTERADFDILSGVKLGPVVISQQPASIRGVLESLINRGMVV